MSRALALVSLLALASCGRPRAPATAADDGEVVLFRDGALIRLPIAVDVTARTAVVRVRLPAGVAPKDIAVVGRGGLVIGALREVVEDPERTPATPATPATPTTPTTPTTIEIAVEAPARGRHVLQLAYITDRLGWQAGYTMTTTPARTRVQVRGALAIRNTTGLDLPAANLALVDAEVDRWRGKLRDDLTSALVGITPSSGTQPARRALGRVALPVGETRVELLPDDPPREMRSVLVYDPFGTALDHSGDRPLVDPELGARATTRVTESFEIVRDPRANAGLPAGPVRLLERRADGTLAVLGEGRVFEATTRASAVDTVALGTAQDVTARRERVELTIDDTAHRTTEEFAITIENTRPVPIDVVVREHNYRGPNWTLAFHSAPAFPEGSQQFSMRTRVPARGRAKTVHVVVYWWSP